MNQFLPHKHRQTSEDKIRRRNSLPAALEPNNFLTCRSSAINTIKEEPTDGDDTTDSDDALNQGFINDDGNNSTDFSHVLNNICKSFFHRRESLPTFLTANPAPTNVSSALSENVNNDGKKCRRNSIDVIRSHTSFRMKKYSKTKETLNQAFIDDKENDIAEYYDAFIERRESNALDDVFEEEKYDRILYLPKPVKDEEIDYKKKYQQLQQRYQKREERISDVKKLILEGKSKSMVLQRLNGILTCAPSSSSNHRNTVMQSRPSLFSEQSDNTIDDLEKEFEKLKVNMEEQHIEKTSFKNITEEYLEKFSDEESAKRTLHFQLNEKIEECENLKAQLSVEKENPSETILELKNENEMLKTNLEKEISIQNELFGIIKNCREDVKTLSTFGEDLQAFITVKDDEISSLRNNLAKEIAKREHVRNVLMPLVKNAYNNIKEQLKNEEDQNSVLCQKLEESIANEQNATIYANQLKYAIDEKDASIQNLQTQFSSALSTLKKEHENLRSTLKKEREISLLLYRFSEERFQKFSQKDSESGDDEEEKNDDMDTLLHHVYCYFSRKLR